MVFIVSRSGGRRVGDFPENCSRNPLKTHRQGLSGQQVRAVMSFELRVLSEDVNQFTQNSRLMTHNARAAQPYPLCADIKGAALD
jgi:hypothetical protein